MIEVGTRVLHIYSKGQRSGVVIPHSGAAAFRGQIRVKWFNSGIADYVLERFLVVDGEQPTELPEIEDILVSVEETEDAQAEECAEAEEPEAIEKEWSGFTVLEDISQEIDMGRVA